MPRKAKDNKPDARAMNDSIPKADIYVLLDRSGSMESKWDDTIGGLNAYAAGLAAQNISGTFTLAAFDDPPHSSYGWGQSWNMDFTFVRTRQPISAFVPIAKTEVTPRGGTPLYDAVSRLVMTAEASAPERAILCIITDGYENASRYTSRGAANEMLDKCRARGWQVIFLGADFDSWPQAQLLGAHVNSTISYAPRAFAAFAQQNLAGSSVQYATTGAAMCFTDRDRKQATGS